MFRNRNSLRFQWEAVLCPSFELTVQGCALELFGDRQVAFVLEWSLELVRPPFLSILQTSFVCFAQASHVFGLKREHLKPGANFHLDDADNGINLEGTGATTTP